MRKILFAADKIHQIYFWSSTQLQGKAFLLLFQKQLLLQNLSKNSCDVSFAQLVCIHFYLFYSCLKQIHTFTISKIEIMRSNKKNPLLLFVLCTNYWTSKIVVFWGSVSAAAKNVRKLLKNYTILLSNCF